MTVLLCNRYSFQTQILSQSKKSRKRKFLRGCYYTAKSAKSKVFHHLPIDSGHKTTLFFPLHKSLGLTISPVGLHCIVCKYELIFLIKINRVSNGMSWVVESHEARLRTSKRSQRTTSGSCSSCNRADSVRERNSHYEAESSLDSRGRVSCETGI
jgi:hypothetical protein